MSDSLTISEVKRMLERMLQESQSPDRIIIDKQKRIDTILENIQTALIGDCHRYGVTQAIIEARLSVFQKAGEIESWVLEPGVDCTIEECFIVKVKPTFSSKIYPIQIDFRDY
jgi:hypothetical protein